MAENRLSDTREGNSVSREFESTWLRTTAIVTAVRFSCRWVVCERRSAPFAAEDAAGTEARLALLSAAVERPGPKFVMAHLLLPHGPFRFGPDCAGRTPVWTTGPEAVPADAVGPLYIEQVECTNRKMLDLVDRIRAASPDTAVIILQADHGFGRFPAGMPPDLEDSSADQVEERFDVFAAYAGPAGLGDSIAAFRTPVNVFRTVFRVLWGLDEPPLEDRFYWSNTDRPMALVGVAVE